MTTAVAAGAWPQPHFTYDAQPGRIVFGAGTFGRVPDEVDRLGAKHVLLIATRSQRAAADRLAGELGARLAFRSVNPVSRVPASVVERATQQAVELGADLALTIGGGAAIGLAKGIALKIDLPILAVPTTYSGSEMTTIWGITEGDEKVTGRDPRVLPRTVVYDPELTVDLPAQIGGPSGMNAMAHCVEALYARNAPPPAIMMAEEGVRALAQALPRVVAAPRDMDARGQALYGAHMAGAALAVSDMGVHHRLCHILGGKFNLPHAETHSVLLPHAAAFNADAAPEAMARIASALDAEAAPSGLYELAAAVGAPLSLDSLGLPEDALDHAAELATAAPYPNPRPIDRDGVRSLLEMAYRGKRPE